MASNQPVHRYPYTYSGSKRSSNYQYSKSEEADRNAFSTPVNCPLPNGDLWFEVIWDGYKAFLENKVAAPSNPASPPRLGGSSKGDGDHLPKVSLKGNLSFEDQVIDIVKQIELTKEDYEDYTLALNDIYDVFYKDVPGLVPIVYGSVLSTLAMRGSDLDVLLFSRDVLIPSGFLKSLRYEKFPPSILSITPVQNAAVPTVRTAHSLTGIQSDITSNLIDVSKGLLVRHLALNVPHFRTSVMMILYFFNSSTRKTLRNRVNFTIVLLFIFFLQNLPDPLVLPLHHILGRTTTMPLPCIVLYMNPVPPEYKSNYSLYFLIREFFFYYTRLDFRTNFISPFLGKVINVIDYFSSNPLDPIFDPYIDALTNRNCPKKNKIYVQDPVELNKMSSEIKKEDFKDFFVKFSRNFVKIHRSWSKEGRGELYVPFKYSRKYLNMKKVAFTVIKPDNLRSFQINLTTAFENLLFCQINFKRGTTPGQFFFLIYELRMKIDMLHKTRVHVLNQFLQGLNSMEDVRSQAMSWLKDDLTSTEYEMVLCLRQKKMRVSIEPCSDSPIPAGYHGLKEYFWPLINTCALFCET